MDTFNQLHNTHDEAHMSAQETMCDFLWHELGRDHYEKILDIFLIKFMLFFKDFFDNKKGANLWNSCKKNLYLFKSKLD